jgi:aminoglycoside phosphotransferase (APT) family kinase protein
VAAFVRIRWPLSIGLGGRFPSESVAAFPRNPHAAFTVTPVTTHGDLSADNLIGPLPMLVDWEYAQLADPVYDLACLSVYYPGLQLRGEELLFAAGITDANGATRLQLHAQMFNCLNRLWEGGGGVAAGLGQLWPAPATPDSACEVQRNGRTRQGALRQRGHQAGAEGTAVAGNDRQRVET